MVEDCEECQRVAKELSRHAYKQYKAYFIARNIMTVNIIYRHSARAINLRPRASPWDTVPATPVLLSRLGSFQPGLLQPVNLPQDVLMLRGDLRQF